MCEVPRQRPPRRFDGDRAQGELTIVEIKVSKADLLGDQKWTDYLDYCDRFFGPCRTPSPDFWKRIVSQASRAVDRRPL
jgi:hypothetical protein